MRATIALASAAALLGACATGTGVSRYGAEMERLEQECRARGGVLVPGPRVSSSNPAANYSCQRYGGASRIN